MRLRKEMNALLILFTLTGCGLFSKARPTQTAAAGMLPLGTTTFRPTDIPTSTPTSDNWVTNRMTDTRYHRVLPPAGFAGWGCFDLTGPGLHTVFGAVVAGGPDSGRYNDVGRAHVWKVTINGHVIESTFPTSAMPPNSYRDARPASVVCSK